MEKKPEVKTGPAPQSPGTSAMVPVSETQITTVDMFDQNRAKSALMVAATIATSSLIPEHYQRRPDNVLVAMYRAARLGIDLFAYMEVTYPVHGRLGHEAKFVVSLINTSGKFKTPLMYEMIGDIIREPNGSLSPKSTRKCKAWAVLKETNDKLSQEIGLDMAFSEGWATKPGPDKTLKTNKWQTMPDIMLQYRAAKFFGNMYCPELVMGLDTKDELNDIADAEIIEEAAAGKDIFDKGTEVSTAAEPVLDPALKVEQPGAQMVSKGGQPAPAATVPLEQPAAALAPAAAPQAPAEQPSSEPPKETPAFREWLQKTFSGESSTIDAFLTSKKWLAPGETMPDLSDSKLKNLLVQWPKFVVAYDAFKKTRKQ
jgi:hypothetical protein